MPKGIYLRTIENRQNLSKAHLGQKAWNKGLKSKLSNELHPAWKGAKVMYRALHYWIERHKGTPQECENCGVTEIRRYHWANIDHQYKRNLEDWVRLCVPCHKNYDLGKWRLNVN